MASHCTNFETSARNSQGPQTTQGPLVNERALRSALLPGRHAREAHARTTGTAKHARGRGTDTHWAHSRPTRGRESCRPGTRSACVVAASHATRPYAVGAVGRDSRARAASVTL